MIGIMLKFIRGNKMCLIGEIEIGNAKVVCEDEVEATVPFCDYCKHKRYCVNKRKEKNITNHYCRWFIPIDNHIYYKGSFYS